MHIYMHMHNFQCSIGHFLHMAFVFTDAGGHGKHNADNLES